ncbi:MAG: ACP S-malonyltransferase [Bacteroidota bacterium]
MNQELAFIFPPFVNEYFGNEKDIISSFGYNIEKLLKQSQSITSYNFTSFDEESNNFIGEELPSQYLAYIFSCAVSDILTSLHIKPSLVSGYSMGIYAALYHTGAISFKTGLDLIQKAFQIITNHTQGNTYSMATIVGFTENDIIELIGEEKDTVEIINRNNQHTYVISGIRPIVEKIVQRATEEGALYCRILKVNSPYHSRFMHKAAAEFSNYISGLEIQTPNVPIVSLLNQYFITSTAEIAIELANNIHNRMNWQATVETMNQSGIKLFIECGAGESLSKIGKFIDGDFQTIHLGKLPKFLSRHTL